MAFLAALIFIGASGTTNLTYGWGKGDTLATSCVWGSVAGAVAIVFALSWPALIRSVETRQWSAAVISLVAMLLSGAYSVTAALGSAAGGRANATAVETATTDTRTKAQAAYDTAKAEIEALSAAKPGVELQAQIEAARAELAKVPSTRSIAELEALQRAAAARGCAPGSTLKGQVKASCPNYGIELARAWERQRLTNRIAELGKDVDRADQRHAERRDRAQAAMDRASAELSATRPAKVANSDARALSRYLLAVGIDVTPDRLNDLLVLLAVLMIEAGGGLSLAVGMALQTAPETRPLVEQKAADGDEDAAAQPQSLSMPVQVTKPSKQHPDMSAPRPAKHGRQSKATAEKRIVDAIRGRGGRLEGGSVRRLAKMVRGRRSTVHNAVAGLIAAGTLARIGGELVLQG